MTSERLDVDAEAERILPLDGPYPPDQIKDAADIAAELIRHLNHATQANTPLVPADVDRVISGLERLVMLLPQTFRQLSQMLTAAADNEDLRSDGLTPKYLTEPAVIAQLAADLLRDDATGPLHAAHATLAHVRTLTARLYLDTNAGDESA